MCRTKVYHIYIMEKHLRGKTFWFRVENGYSLENFRDNMLIDLYCQSTRL